MNWIALAQLLYALFGPIIEAWLKKLLGPEEVQQMEFGLFPSSPSTAITKFFAGARARTSWYQWGARAKLAVLERIAKKHTGRIAVMLAGSRNSTVPVLDRDDAKAIADLL